MRRFSDSNRNASDKGGFTLAELMLTIMIVAIGLMMVVQGLSTAKMKALQTYNMKASRDLGMLTMGRIRAGLYQEELDSRLSGNYAEEGFPHFYFEVLLGDEQFDESGAGDEDGPFHDSWRAKQEFKEREERESDSDEDDDELEDDFEKVRVKVSFPPVPEYTSHVILEEWIIWNQVYGLSDEEKEAKEAEEAAEATR